MTNESPSLANQQNLSRFKRRAFELCLAVYRVTKLFPPGEVLISQLRKTASQIVVLLAVGRIHDTILKVEELKIFLAIAKEQNWLKPINFDLLKSAYSLLENGLEQIERQAGPVAGKRMVTTPLPKIKKELEEKIPLDLNQRQKIILDYFQKSKEAKVSDLLKILGDVSERTIRNDLTNLIGKNLIRKVGSRKDARYLLNA